jgi:hypothetical protein
MPPVHLFQSSRFKDQKIAMVMYTYQGLTVRIQVRLQVNNVYKHFKLFCHKKIKYFHVV